MELAVLAARIDACRQVVEQRLIEGAAGERAIELARIDAGQPRLQPPSIISRASSAVGFVFQSGNSGSRPVPASRSSR